MRLQTLEGMNTRPTTDRVKENLFNILSPYIEGSTVLDLFAGSGSLGIEALSRGAASAVFADQSEKCTEIIINNLKHTGLEHKSEVFLGEAQLILKKLSQHGKKFDIIFLDPPYKKGILPEILLLLQEYDILEDRFIISAETDIEDELPQEQGSIVTSRVQLYGKTKLTFYKRN